MSNYDPSTYGDRIADTYDSLYPPLAGTDPMIATLAELAAGGRLLPASWPSDTLRPAGQQDEGGVACASRSAIQMSVSGIDGVLTLRCPNPG
jgi:hypothetical protein